MGFSLEAKLLAYPHDIVIGRGSALQSSVLLKPSCLWNIHHSDVYGFRTRQICFVARNAN